MFDTLFVFFIIEMLQYLKNSQEPTISQKYKLRPGSGLSGNQIGLNKRMFAALFDDGHKDKELCCN